MNGLGMGMGMNDLSFFSGAKYKSYGSWFHQMLRGYFTILFLVGCGDITAVCA